MKLIAETAWHHDGDFNFLKSLVSSIANKTKADFIKFHLTLDIDEYMHKDHTAYQWAKERVISKKQWDEIFKITVDSGKKLMLLFNDTKSVDFGMSYNPDLVEIHSVCLSDIHLLKYLGQILKGKSTEIVLGVGGTDLYEIENAIEILNHNKVTLMHGFQNYPTSYENINFSKISKIMRLYPRFKHGYADHTFWNNENNVLITLLGAGLGMNYIEKHVTTLPGHERTDWQSAVSIKTFSKIYDKLQILKLSMGNGLLDMNDGEKSYSKYGLMKKAPILINNKNSGQTLKLRDVSFKRTSQSSDMSLLELISKIGNSFLKNKKKGDALNKSDFD